MYQSKYDSIKKQADNLFKSLTSTIDLLTNSNESRNKLLIENVKRIKNEFRFNFIGISLYILVKHSIDKGIIEWGYIKTEMEEENRVELYKEEYDKFGNILNTENGFNNGIISEYGYAFFPNLLTVIEKYFNVNKEANFYYE